VTVVVLAGLAAGARAGAKGYRIDGYQGATSVCP
jgi:hypothetical protein